MPRPPRALAHDAPTVSSAARPSPVRNGPRRAAIAACIAVGLAANACGAAPTAVVVVEDDDPGLPPTPTYTATQEAFAANVNPLSGLPSDTAEIAARRPRAVAIEVPLGANGAGPSGVQTTEVVFWSLAPAPAPGVTEAPSGTLRLTALTLEPPEGGAAIGPLGPVDPVAVEVARSFGASVTAASATEAVAEALRAADIALTRVSGRAAGGAGQGSDAAGGALAETTPAGPPPEPPRWGYSESPLGKLDRPAESVTLSPPGGTPVVVRLDRVLGVWRLGWGAPSGASGSAGSAGSAGPDAPAATLADIGTGEPLAVANVVVLTLPASDPATGDLGWHGEGPALVLRDGVAQSGRWLRGVPDQPFGLIDGDGLAVALRPGNTWVVLVPAGTGVEVDDGGMFPDGGP